MSVTVGQQRGAVQVWRVTASGDEGTPPTAGDERVRPAFCSPDGRCVDFQPRRPTGAAWLTAAATAALPFGYSSWPAVNESGGLRG